MASKDARTSGPDPEKVAIASPTTTTTTTTASPEETRQGATVPSFNNRVIIIAAIGLAVFLSSLDATVVATIVPTLTDEFKSVSDIGWYGSAYLLVTGSVLPVMGKVYTIFQPKRVFLASVFLLEVGSLICALAQNSNAFIGGRAVAGLGSAGLVSGGLIITALVTPLQQRPIAMGIIGSLEGVALIVGPLIGGSIASRIGWRWCFWINLPTGAILCAALVFFFHPPAGSPDDDDARAPKTFAQKMAQIDFVGGILITGSLTCLLLALQWGGLEYPWSSGRVIAPLVVFGASFIGVGLHQHWKGEGAIFPTRLLRNKWFVACLIFGLCIGSAQFVVLYYLPIWFQAVQGVSAEESGVRTLPLVLSVICVAVVAGIGVSRVGFLPPFMMGATILTSVGAGLLHTLGTRTPVARWVGYQILYGAGSGVGIQLAIAGVQIALQPADVAYGTSAIMTMNTVGGAIFISVAQNVFLGEAVKVAAQIPEIDAHSLQDGFQSLRGILPPSELIILIQGYNAGVNRVFLVVLGLCCGSVVTWPFLRWDSIKEVGRQRSGAGGTS